MKLTQVRWNCVRVWRPVTWSDGFGRFVAQRNRCSLTKLKTGTLKANATTHIIQHTKQELWTLTSKKHLLPHTKNKLRKITIPNILYHTQKRHSEPSLLHKYFTTNKRGTLTPHSPTHLTPHTKQALWPLTPPHILYHTQNTHPEHSLPHTSHPTQKRFNLNSQCPHTSYTTHT